MSDAGAIVTSIVRGVAVASLLLPFVLSLSAPDLRLCPAILEEPTKMTTFFVTNVTSLSSPARVVYLLRSFSLPTLSLALLSATRSFARPRDIYPPFSHRALSLSLSRERAGGCAGTQKIKNKQPRRRPKHCPITIMRRSSLRKLERATTLRWKMKLWKSYISLSFPARTGSGVTTRGAPPPRYCATCNTMCEWIYLHFSRAWARVYIHVYMRREERGYIRARADSTMRRVRVVRASPCVLSASAPRYPAWESCSRAIISQLWGWEREREAPAFPLSI